MTHKQVLTEIVKHSNDREHHRIIDVIHEWGHWSEWKSEKIKADINPIDVTKQVIIDELPPQTSWKAFDEKLPNGGILRTIFVFDEPDWPAQDMTFS